MVLPVTKWDNRYNLPTLVKREGFCYFEISDPSGKIFSYSTADNLEEVSDQLNDALGDFEGGEFIVSLYPKKKAATGIKQFRFKAPVQSAAIGSVDIDTKIQLALLKQEILLSQKHKAELEAMESKIKQLEEQEEEEEIGAVAQIKNIAAEFGLSPVDIGNLVRSILPKQAPAAINGVSGIDTAMNRIVKHIGPDMAESMLNSLANQLDANKPATIAKLMQIFS